MYVSYLYVLIRDFIICSEVFRGTAGGSGPPEITERSSANALTGPHPSIPSHSQKGASCSISNVCNRFNVNVVVVQRLRVCGGAHLCQEDAKPAPKLLGTARLPKQCLLVIF